MPNGLGFDILTGVLPQRDFIREGANVIAEDQYQLIFHGLGSLEGPLIVIGPKWWLFIRGIYYKMEDLVAQSEAGNPLGELYSEFQSMFIAEFG